MARRAYPHARKVLLVVALLLLAAWLLPRFFSGQRYHRRLEARLRQTLGRPVDFGAVSLVLLPRPGFMLENVMVREEPAFGSEPFARADRVECSLRLGSLWRSVLDCARLRLEGATLNLVRNSEGRWNVQQFARDAARGLAASSPAAAGGGSPSLAIEADEARVNFSVGANKKPLAITDVRVRLNLDARSRRAQFELTGSPVRTDLGLPTPGPLELSGDWNLSQEGFGFFTATLRARGALVYDWIPLLTGRNPGIYGVLDAEFRLRGAYPSLDVVGQGRITQLHPWGRPPPSDLPVSFDLRGSLDRSRGRVLVDAMNVAFAASRLSVRGAVQNIPTEPELGLVVALDRSRLEDVLGLARRLGAGVATFGASGEANGILTLQGPWRARQLEGFATARRVRLTTPAGSFPVSDVTLRIANQAIQLMPARIAVAPGVEVTAQGAFPLRASEASVPTGSTDRNGRSEKTSPVSGLLLSAKAVPLRDLLRLAQNAGSGLAREIQARGLATVEVRLSGFAWPRAMPAVSGEAELRGARIAVPGMTEPLEVSHARVRLSDGSIVVDPLAARIGDTPFTGRLERRAGKGSPWQFDLQAQTLDLAQGASWFEGFSRPASLPLLDYLPGLRSLTAGRGRQPSLFSRLNARGHIALGQLRYRSAVLGDVSASVEVQARVLRVSSITSHAAGGVGRGAARVDLTALPAKISGTASLHSARVQTWQPHLPLELQRTRGLVSGSVRFETRGRLPRELGEHLKAEATLQFQNLSFGDFDPLVATARAAGWGKLAPQRADAMARAAVASFEVANGLVSLKNVSLTLNGAEFSLTGNCAFNGQADFRLRADFSRIAGRLTAANRGLDPDRWITHLQFVGPLNRLTLVPPDVSAAAGTRPASAH